MSVTLLEITKSPPSAGPTTGHGSRGSERVSLSPQASPVVGKMPQKSLNLITIWGAARSGKSFFMNALARSENDVFQVAGGSDPCTVGAFISTTTRSLSEFGSESGGPSLSSSFSGMKIESDEDPAIGFVDVEGQGDKHISYEIKLATPLLLLSKVVIFNWHGLPNKATMLDRLGMMSEAAGRVDRSQRKDAFGDLVVLVRDVDSEKEEMKIQSLLFKPEEDFYGPNITDEEEKQMKLRNEIRAGLKASFKSLRVCCLPAPHAEINGDREISQSEVSPAFAAKVNKLRLELAKDVLKEVHSFAGEKVVGGEMISSLLTVVCDAVNRDLKVFSPLSLMESVQHERAKTVLAESKNLFSKSVSTSVEGAPSMSKAALKKVVEAAASTAVDSFTQQNLAESVASEYRKLLDEAITDSSNACYAVQERQVSDAKNRIDGLRSDSLLRVDTKASEIFVKLPMEDEELERSWRYLCSDVHGDLIGDIKKHVGTGILEDLQELPTLQQLRESVLGKFNNLKGSNISLRRSVESTQAMKKELNQQKEDTATLQQQLDEQRELREEQQRVLEEMKESRDEEERARQKERDAENRRHMIENAMMLISAVAGAMNSGGQGQATRESGSSSNRTEAPAAAAAAGRHPGDVDVGPMFDHEDAEEKAREYMNAHPDKEWTGHWKTPFIRVRNKS